MFCNALWSIYWIYFGQTSECSDYMMKLMCALSFLISSQQPLTSPFSLMVQCLPTQAPKCQLKIPPFSCNVLMTFTHDGKRDVSCLTFCCTASPTWPCMTLASLAVWSLRWTAAPLRRRGSAAWPVRWPAVATVSPASRLQINTTSMTTCTSTLSCPPMSGMSLWIA